MLRGHRDGSTVAAISVEQSVGPYDLFEVLTWNWNDAVFLGLEILKGREDANAELERILPTLKTRWAQKVAIVALCRSRRSAGKPIPPQYDSVIVTMMDHERPPLAQLSTEVLADLPAERRDPILLSLPLPADLR